MCTYILTKLILFIIHVHKLVFVVPSLFDSSLMCIGGWVVGVTLNPFVLS
jgi:hypothetical protein